MSSTSIQTILFCKPKQNDERGKCYLANKSQPSTALMNSWWSADISRFKIWRGSFDEPIGQFLIDAAGQLFLSVPQEHSCVKGNIVSVRR